MKKGGKGGGEGKEKESGDRNGVHSGIRRTEGDKGEVEGMDEVLVDPATSVEEVGVVIHEED